LKDVADKENGDWFATRVHNIRVCVCVSSRNEKPTHVATRRHFLPATKVAKKKATAAAADGKFASLAICKAFKKPRFLWASFCALILTVHTHTQIDRLVSKKANKARNLQHNLITMLN
jgi:hypothetical protein